jgi:hypothetical protein
MRFKVRGQFKKELETTDETVLARQSETATDCGDRSSPSLARGYARPTKKFKADHFQKQVGKRFEIHNSYPHDVEFCPVVTPDFCW